MIAPTPESRARNHDWPPFLRAVPLHEREVFSDSAGEGIHPETPGWLIRQPGLATSSRRKVRDPMIQYGRKAILAADTTIEDTRHLLRSLSGLGFRVYPATSVSQILELLRHKVIQEAVVAVEFTCGHQILLARLPALTDLVAVGPAGDHAAEAMARAAGARTYVGRPVTTEELAVVLQIPHSPTERRNRGGDGHGLRANRV